MKLRRSKLLAATLLCFSAPAFATGMATCDSGPKEQWQKPEVLEKMLEAQGWSVRRIKEDGGCYEVYALDKQGERVEAYFHPESLERIPVDEH